MIFLDTFNEREMSAIRSPFSNDLQIACICSSVTEAFRNPIFLAYKIFSYGHTQRRFLYELFNLSPSI